MEATSAFPSQEDKQRLAAYEHYDRIGYGDHFNAFAVKGEEDFALRYRQLRYIVANFGGLMSRTMADMLFGEPITFDYDNDGNQEFASAFIEENQLMTQLHESAIGNSRRGDDVFKLRIGQRNPRAINSPVTVIAEQVTPAIYFPVLTDRASRNTSETDVIAHTFKDGDRTLIHLEIHEPGVIFHEVFEYDQKAGKLGAKLNPTEFGYKESEPTGVDRSLVFHVPNVRDGSGFWGVSDYSDLQSLFFALNNRITKVDNILDKHADPILAVPPGVIGDDGKVRKEALGLIEVDPEGTGLQKPEYIVWDANMDASFKQIDKLVEMLFMFSEISPATTGMDKDGQMESGRALKLKLLATIRKRNRKRQYYDQAIKDMMQTAAELSLALGVKVGDQLAPEDNERPKLKWPDGVVNDEVEQVEQVGQRIEQGTMSQADGIAFLDGMTKEEAEAKAEEIRKEGEPNIPVIGDKPEQPEEPPTIEPPKAPKPQKPKE